MCYCILGGGNKMRSKSRPCPSCPDNSYVSSSYIDELVEAKKNSGIDLAEEEIYRARLLICSDCDSCLKDMVCMKCGCFVQLRALNKEGRCPHPEGNKWM